MKGRSMLVLLVSSLVLTMSIAALAQSGDALTISIPEFASPLFALDEVKTAIEQFEGESELSVRIQPFHAYSIMEEINAAANIIFRQLADLLILRAETVMSLESQGLLYSEDGKTFEFPLRGGWSLVIRPDRRYPEVVDLLTSCLREPLSLGLLGWVAALPPSVEGWAILLDTPHTRTAIEENSSPPADIVGGYTHIWMPENGSSDVQASVDSGVGLLWATVFELRNPEAAQMAWSVVRDEFGDCATFEESEGEFRLFRTEDDLGLTADLLCQGQYLVMVGSAITSTDAEVPDAGLVQEIMGEVRTRLVRYIAEGGLPSAHNQQLAQASNMRPRLAARPATSWLSANYALPNGGHRSLLALNTFSSTRNLFSDRHIMQVSSEPQDVTGMFGLPIEGESFVTNDTIFFDMTPHLTPFIFNLDLDGGLNAYVGVEFETDPSGFIRVYLRGLKVHKHGDDGDGWWRGDGDMIVAAELYPLGDYTVKINNITLGEIAWLGPGEEKTWASSSFSLGYAEFNREKVIRCKFGLLVRDNDKGDLLDFITTLCGIAQHSKSSRVRETAKMVGTATDRVKSELRVSEGYVANQEAISRAMSIRGDNVGILRVTFELKYPQP